MTEPPWDDKRVRAAFARRFDGAAPANLPADIGSRLRSRRRAPRSIRLQVAAAGALMLTLVVGAALVVTGPRIPKPSDTSPPPSTSVVDGFPTQMLGLPVISVSEAIALRDAGPDGTEIAVRGYVPPPPPTPVSCPAPLRPPTPVELHCPEFTVSWLTEEPERTWEAFENGWEGRRPVGPTLQPLYRLEVPTAPSDGAVLSQSEPLPVVLVGHFADYRSLLCPDVPACRREFVVDARAWVDGREAGREIVRVPGDARPRLEADQVMVIAHAAARVPLADPWIAVLARQYVVEVDPRIAETAGLDKTAIVWVVRQLVEDRGSAVARTFLVNDETGSIFVAGPAGLVAVADDRPAASHAPFPSEAFGLQVISVEQAIVRHGLASAAPNDEELAVRGYFVAPPSEVACLDEPILGEPRTAICPDDPLSWLMADLEMPWRTLNLRGDWRRPVGPALNLVAAPDVLVDVPAAFDPDSEPNAVPVVVLAHFLHERETNSPFHRWLVVDAVVWRDGDQLPGDTVRLGVEPSEELSSVERRIEAHAGAGLATWATAMSGSSFAEAHQNPSVFDQELGRAPIVWQIRRLVSEGGYPVVRSAWTADGGTRVWLELRFDLYELQPTHTVVSGSVTVDVVDYYDKIVDAVEGTGTDPADAIVAAGSESHPSLRLSNPGADAQTLRITWDAGNCSGLWRLEVAAISPRPSIELRYPGLPCGPRGQRHSIVLAFADPMPAAGVTVNISTGVGG